MSSTTTPTAGEQAHETAPDGPPSTLDMELRAWARGPRVLSEVAEQVRLPAELEGARAGLCHALAELPAPRPGDVLDGRYALERVLGRGGMGVVYAARNVRTGKMVAVKRIAGELGRDPARAHAAAERMRKEARAAGRIQHPNVVDLIDVGGSDDAPYLVMELLEGESLAHRRERGRLDWSEAVALLVPVLSGLSAAHAAGVVHRDLKPDNLFLCRTPSGIVVPKLLDFGVAAMRPESGGESHGLTRTGAVIGTPAYMPPEQLTGGTVDVRSDLYALCVVLYELLTGELPHRASNAGELAVQRATREPKRPSSVVPALRGAREALLLKGLARDPDARFQSAAELSAALLAVDRRRPARRGLVLFGAALALGALAAWSWGARSEAHRAAQAREPARPAASTEGATRDVPPLHRGPQPAAQDVAAPPAQDVAALPARDVAAPPAMDGVALPARESHPRPAAPVEPPRTRRARPDAAAAAESPAATVDPHELRVEDF